VATEVTYTVSGGTLNPTHSLIQTYNSAKEFTFQFNVCLINCLQRLLETQTQHYATICNIYVLHAIALT